MLPRKNNSVILTQDCNYPDFKNDIHTANLDQTFEENKIPYDNNPMLKSIDDTDINIEETKNSFFVNRKDLNSSTINASTVEQHDNSILRNDSQYGAYNKGFFGNVKSSIDKFVNNFHQHYQENLIKSFSEGLADLNNEKTFKKFETFKTYHSQIAEMQLMLREDESHLESIKIIVENLEDEMKSELKKIDQEFDELIEKRTKQFKTESIKTQGFKILEEKFKIDMLNNINEVIYPKK